MTPYWGYTRKKWAPIPKDDELVAKWTIDLVSHIVELLDSATEWNFFPIQIGLADQPLA